MRDFSPVLLALVAVVAGNVLLWRERPTAQPVAPQSLAAPEPAAKGSKPAPGKTAPTTAKLNLGMPADNAPLQTDGSAAAALQTPRAFKLNLAPAALIRPQVEKLKLFDSDYGTHGFSRRQWLSAHLGIQGGVGYATDPNAPDARRPAIGLGLVLTY